MTKTADLKVIEKPEKKKRRRFNKNKKKAWRKKIDISDVEEALVQERREERQGGALCERKSEDFFEIDFRDQKQEFEEEKLKKKKKKDSKKEKPLVKRLKCHQFLDGLPGVKAITRTNTGCRQYPSKVMRTALNRSGETLKDEVKRLIAQDQRKDAKRKDNISRAPLSCKNVHTDIWTDGPPAKKKKDASSFKVSRTNSTYLRKGLEHYKKVTNIKPKKVPKVRMKRPNLIPALILPDSGMSYNPTLRDHQKLMSKAIKEEEGKKEKEKKRKKTLERIFPSKREAPTQESYLKEMSEGLKKEDDDSGRGSSDELHPEEQGSDKPPAPPMEGDIKTEAAVETSLSVSAPRIAEKKSKQQRTKAKRIKIAQRQKEAAKQRRIQESNIFRVKTYMKEIKEMENLKVEKSIARKKKEERKKYTTQRLSKHKFVEADTLVPLGDELTDSLREVKPIGSIMEDQFNSLLRRNIVEPKNSKSTERKRKRKIKKFIKRSKRPNI